PAWSTAPPSATGPRSAAPPPTPTSRATTSSTWSSPPTTATCTRCAPAARRPPASRCTPTRSPASTPWRRRTSAPPPTPTTPTFATSATRSRASPVLAPLQGTGKLDIVIPGWDGMVYAWAPDGTRLPGWPVDIKLPQPDFDRDGVDPARYMRDPKLMYPVGVADVLGTGKPQVFVSSFECSGKSASTQDTALGLTPVGSNPASKAWLYGVWADGNDHPGGAYLPHWPAALPS